MSLKWVKAECSNLVCMYAVVSDRLGTTNHPEIGVVKARDPILGPHNYETDKYRHFP